MDRNRSSKQHKCEICFSYKSWFNVSLAIASRVPRPLSCKNHCRGMMFILSTHFGGPKLTQIQATCSCIKKNWRGPMHKPSLFIIRKHQCSEPVCNTELVCEPLLLFLQTETELERNQSVLHPNWTSISSSSTPCFFEQIQKQHAFVYFLHWFEVLQRHENFCHWELENPFLGLIPALAVDMNVKKLWTQLNGMQVWW